MAFLDARTILISYSLCNLVCAIVLFSLWRQNRSRFAGLDYFMLSFSINFIGVILLALRGIAPDFLSLLLGNYFLIACVLLLFIGISHFLGRKFNQTHNYVLFALYVILQAWLVYGYPNLQYRMILFSIMISIYCVQMTWMLFTHQDPKIKAITRGLGVISILYWAVGIIRIGYEIFQPTHNDIFDAGPFETLVYLTFQLVYIVLTFFLFMIVNRRLVVNLEDDIDIQKQTEAELELSQEKFLKSFQSSPNIVLLSRMSDGKIIEANDQFFNISGYTREETIGNSTISLKLWVDPEDRKKVVALMKKEGEIKDYEFDARIKSGRILKFLFSGAEIKINNEIFMLSYMQDITERKKSEVIIRLRLTLWEYASSHTIIELMQKSLDEIEDLTNSVIGFFHLVDGNSENLILQAWSTRTKEKFCKAEGEGMHYPLKSAGVWCDGVREKKPIIHNDYASLTNQKGMPDGHAEVKRELVVPVMRNGQVAAVLGLGNKPIDYDMYDVDLVANVADLVWSIVLQKQADDEIQKLNSQLERLALTDELTKLSNRRAFFINGNAEIVRAKRYRSPLSMIMLDIDKFKKINDTFGHDFGDMALQCAAQILMDHVREVDKVGRLGGEEFGILLPHTEGEKAMLLAERLRAAFEEKSCTKMDRKVSFTASFGVAELTDEIQNLDDLLRNADLAMYQAKNQGRNRVVKFDSNK